MATTTLTTTTLARSVSIDDCDVLLDSLSGVEPGRRLFLDGELMAVEGAVLPGGLVRVRRGVDSILLCLLLRLKNAAFRLFVLEL